MCKILSFVCDKFIISLMVFHSYYEKHNYLEIFLLATWKQTLYLVWRYIFLPLISSQCSYIPKCGKNYEESMSLVNVVMENFRKYQRFSCFYDPEGVQKNVILTKLYSSNVLFHSLFWPTCMMIGGVAIVAMVKLTQYLSLLCERIQRINR